MLSGLVHAARFVGRARAGTRSAQGSYDSTASVGPWIDARVMEMGSVAAKARQSPASTEARVLRGYQILLDDSDQTGATYARPTASSVLETDCPILGSPTIQLSGEPEVLTNGEDLIGYLLLGDVVRDRS